MNSIGKKITLAIALIASVVGIVMLFMIFFKGNEAIIAGDAQGLTYGFIYLAVAMLFIALLYFLVAGILSLVLHPSQIKKQALILITLVIIIGLFAWLAKLDVNALSNASFINTDASRLTDYFGLSADQINSISSWKSWLNTSFVVTGILLVVAGVAFIFDMIKSSIK